ncbi:helix-turn-helix domain-containing protein [Faecalimonas sp.]
MKILLDEIMTEKNISLRQLERLSGIPKSTIHDILNGAIPKIDVMEKLAKGLKIHIEELYQSPYK